jgi:hypothetical protein
MKQTAIEWLLDSLDYNQNMLGIKEIIEQAKQMEKEQINDACYEGYYQEGMYDTRAYYDKKYKQQ